MKVSWYNNSIRIVGAQAEQRMVQNQGAQWSEFEEIAESEYARLFIDYTRSLLDLLKTLLGAPDLDTKLTEQQILASQGDMGHLVMDYAFGDVWMRPQLSRRDRSVVVISCLTALNLKHELEIHIGGALNHGVTREEVEEVMITMVLYGGFPRAIDGMILARKVFEARDNA